MKQIFSAMFLIWPAIAISAQINQSINIKTENVKFEVKGDYTHIIYGIHSSTDSIGHPDVPVIYKRYAIPLDAVNVSLQSSVQNIDTLSNNIILYPVQPPQPITGTRKDFVEPDSIIYQSNNPYPHKSATILSDERIMGYRVITIASYPIVYHPKDKILYKRDIAYTLNYESNENTLFVSTKISEKRAKSIQLFIESLVENKDDISNRNVNFIPGQRMTTADLSVRKDVIPDYVIITNNKLKPEFQRLANWKTKKGVPTIIKTVEEIENEYIGSDFVDKIRNYIIELENRWGGEGLYLLLGGDTDIIPTRQAKSWNEYDEHYATDAFYVDDNFEVTNWTNYSVKSSQNRNILMGRIPVSTILEAKNFITRLIHYEKADSEIDYSYLNNFLVTSAFMKKDYSEYDYIFENLDSYVKKYVPNYIKTWYLFDHFNCSCSTNVHRYIDYNREYGSELNRENFLNLLQNGSTQGYPHLISYSDHGYVYTLSTSLHDKGEKVSTGNIKTLDSIPYQNIIITESCNTANFSEDCIGENFLRKNTIAYIGNTDYGLILEYDLPKFYLNDLYAGQSDKKYFSVGYIYNSLLKNRITLAPHRFHLLGDPEMSIWTNEPQNLDVMVSPTTQVYASSQTPVTVKVKINNLPVNETATVCIMKDTEIYNVMEVSDNTEHTFMCTPLTQGTIHVTITAHNFRPYETAIPVTANTPVLSIESINFLSAHSHENDGIISPGEEVKLRFTLKNSGNYDVNNVNATLTTSSPYITFTNNHLTNGHIRSKSAHTFSDTIKFNVSYDAPEILRNEMNATTFYLSMDKGSLGVDVDTFRVDLIPPKYKIVSHKRNGSMPLVAGQSHTFTTETVNLGRIQLVPQMEMFPETSGIEKIEKVYTDIWYVKLASDYQSGDPVKVRVNLYADSILTDSQIIDLQEDKVDIKASYIGIVQAEDAVTLYWNRTSNEYGYHVYRSDTPTGTYTRLNKLPLTGTNGFYIDEDLEPNTTYYYKVSAVNHSLIEGNMSDPIEVHTLCKTVDGFPVMFSGDIHDVYSAPTTTDLDYDGQKEIIATLRNEGNQTSKAFVLKADGSSLYDIDNNPATANEFASFAYSQATPTIADLYGTGETCLITAPHSNEKRLHCYSSLDKDNNNRPDSLWSALIGCIVWRSPVVTDINSPNGKGEKEIIVLGNPASNRIWVLDCHGNKICSMSTDSTDYIMPSPAVADLDGDGYKEIISGCNKHLYIWKHNGTPYGNQACHYTTPDGAKLNSSPVIFDFDGDGSKDVIIATSESLTSHILVIKQDGTCLSGFDGSTTAASIPYTKEGASGRNHRIALGDIDGDSLPEIVALGRNYVRAWKNNGIQCLNYYSSGLFPNSNAVHNFRMPILADVNGDESIDIIFNQDNVIYAITHTGNTIKGFPLKTQTSIRNGLTVSDIDNDGLNELVTGDDTGYIYVWKTTGKASAIEWGRAQFDTENTSEYVSGYKDQWVVTENTSWTGGTFTNDIIVRSGTLTIPQGCTLTMRKPYRIYVMDGATLHVDGGTIANADIVIKKGGKLNITNNGTIQKRVSGGNVNINTGGLMDMTFGSIQ